MATISEDGDFTDFTLESEDGTKFPVHRNILAAQSSVLKRMFLNPMEERKTASLQLMYKAVALGRLPVNRYPNDRFGLFANPICDLTC